MSRMNSGILNFDSVAPSTEVAIPAPDFIEGRTVGGQTQVGAPRQQVGPSSAEAGYAALAQIAGGVAKGLDNFADIGSRIEKAKIEKAQLLFDEIDAMEDLDGDTKFTRFEDGIKEVYTPLLGDSWRKNMDNRVRKQWLSGAARDTFEQNRYNKELGEFLQTKGLQSPLQLTDELLDDFQQQYESNHPLAKEVTWYQATRFQTQAGVAKKTADNMTAVFKAKLNDHYATMPPDILNRWSMTQNPEEKKEIADLYPGFAAFLERIETLQTDTDIYNFFYNDMANMARESLKGMPEDLVENLLANMGEVAARAVHEAKKLRFSHNNIVRTSDAVISFETALTNFKADGNINALLDGVLQNAPNFPAEIKATLIPTILSEFYDLAKKMDPTGTPADWKTKANNWFNTWATPDHSAYFMGDEAVERFKEYPEVEQVRGRWQRRDKSSLGNSPEELKKHLESLPNKGELLEKRLLLPGQTLPTTITATWQALNQGNAPMARDVAEVVSKRTTNLKNESGVLQYQKPEYRQSQMEEHRKNTASDLGISVESLLKYFVDQKNGQLSTLDINDWYNTLSPEEQKGLNDSGFGLGTNYQGLQTILNAQLDLEKTFVTAALQEQRREASADSKINTPDEYRTEVLAGDHLDLVNRVLAWDREDTDVVTDLIPTLDLESQLIILQARGLQLEWSTYINHKFNHFDALYNSAPDTDPKKPYYDVMREKYKDLQNTNFYPNDQQQGLNAFLETPNLVIVEPNSKNPVFGARLSREGLLAYEQLKFRFSQLGSDLNNPDSKKEMQAFNEVLVALGTQGIKAIEQNPESIFALTAALSGLQASGSSGSALVTALGIDDSRVKTMVALLETTLDLSNGMFIPDVDDVASEEMFTHTADQVYTTIFAASSAAGAQDVPSIFVGNRAQKPAEITGMLQAHASGGVDIKQMQENLQSMLQRLGMSEEGLYNAIKGASGNIALPDFSQTDGGMWEIQTPDGPEYKDWEDMSVAEKIQIALSQTNNQSMMTKLPMWLSAAGNVPAAQRHLFGKPSLLEAFLNESRSYVVQDQNGDPTEIKQEYIKVAGGLSPPGWIFSGTETTKTQLVYSSPPGSPPRGQLRDAALGILGMHGIIRSNKEQVKEPYLASESKPYTLNAANDEEVVGMALLYGMESVPELPKLMAGILKIPIPDYILNDAGAREGLVRRGLKEGQLTRGQESALANYIRSHLGPELRKGKPSLSVELYGNRPIFVLHIGNRRYRDTERKDWLPAMELLAQHNPYVNSTDELSRRKNLINENLRRVNPLADPEYIRRELWKKDRMQYGEVPRRERP